MPGVILPWQSTQTWLAVWAGAAAGRKSRSARAESSGDFMTASLGLTCRDSSTRPRGPDRANLVGGRPSGSPQRSLRPGHPAPRFLSCGRFPNARTRASGARRRVDAASQGAPAGHHRLARLAARRDRRVRRARHHGRVARGWTSRPCGSTRPAGGGAASRTHAMRRGQRLEPEARALYIRTTRVRVEPVCLEHGAHPWMRGSLDGISADGSVVLEVKCPGATDHAVALSRRRPREIRPATAAPARGLGSAGLPLLVLP